MIHSRLYSIRIEKKQEQTGNNNRKKQDNCWFNYFDSMYDERTLGPLKNAWCWFFAVILINCNSKIWNIHNFGIGCLQTTSLSIELYKQFKFRVQYTVSSTETPTKLLIFEAIFAFMHTLLSTISVCNEKQKQYNQSTNRTLTNEFSYTYQIIVKKMNSNSFATNREWEMMKHSRQMKIPNEWSI